MSNISKKRKLPSWVKGKSKELELCIFTGNVVLVQNEGEANLICTEMLERLDDENFVIGFDSEWDVQGSNSNKDTKTDLIQICPSETDVYLFHLASIGCLPKALKGLVENPRVLKTGVNIRNDIHRLQRQFDIASNGTDLIELSELANNVLNSSQTWSLDRLCEHILQKQLPKDHVTRCSRWSNFSLNSDQISYAATDAYVSWKLYFSLKDKENIKT